MDFKDLLQEQSLWNLSRAIYDVNIRDRFYPSDNFHLTRAFIDDLNQAPDHMFVALLSKLIIAYNSELAKLREQSPIYAQDLQRFLVLKDELGVEQVATALRVMGSMVRETESEDDQT